MSNPQVSANNVVNVVNVTRPATTERRVRFASSSVVPAPVGSIPASAGSIPGSEAYGRTKLKRAKRGARGTRTPPPNTGRYATWAKMAETAGGFNPDRQAAPWGIHKQPPYALPKIVLMDGSFTTRERAWQEVDFTVSHNRVAYAKAHDFIVIGLHGRQEATLNPLGSFAELRLYSSMEESGKAFFWDLTHYVQDTQRKYLCRVTGDRFYIHPDDYKAYYHLVAWEDKTGPDSTGTIEIVSAYAEARDPLCVPSL